MAVKSFIGLAPVPSNMFISGTYKLAVGRWSFFSVVLDGDAKQGLIQLDYAYGYNNGTVDLKVWQEKLFLFVNVYVQQ